MCVLCVFVQLPDIPYSRLPRADGEQEFLNFGELNELDILSQSNSFDLCDIGSVQATQANCINLSPMKKIPDDTDFHSYHNSQIMYQTILQQSQYEHQLQPSQLVSSQPYVSSYQNQHHYTQNYEPMPPDDHYYHDTTMYSSQQPLQNQIYHITTQNGFSDIEYVWRAVYWLNGLCHRRRVQISAMDKHLFMNYSQNFLTAVFIPFLLFKIPVNVGHVCLQYKKKQN